MLSCCTDPGVPQACPLASQVEQTTPLPSIKYRAPGGTELPTLMTGSHLLHRFSNCPVQNNYMEGLLKQSPPPQDSVSAV